MSMLRSMGSGSGGWCGGLMGVMGCFLWVGCFVFLVASWRACCPTRKVLTMSSIWSHSSWEEVLPTIFILFPHINNCYWWFIWVS